MTAAVDPRADSDRRAPARDRATGALSIGAILLAALVAAPILGVIGALAMPSQGAWRHMVDTVLPLYVSNTLALGAMVALGAGAVGVGAAWLVTMCRFPGRAAFEWALAAPLAFPAYVMAYAYTALLDHPGPVQTALRDATGWGPRDYWFPEVRSLGGAALMFVLVLYPYVYLLARAAFLQQSARAFDVARTLGLGPWGAFRRVALPMARPAVVTGVALALMETLSDFGAVAHFGVQTFSTGVYRAWFAMGDRIAAAQLSACLLIFVLALVALERAQRRAARYHPAGGFEALACFRLRGWRAAAAALACALPVLLGFVAPLAMLGEMALRDGHSLFGPRYLRFTLNSITLAALAAALCVLAAVILAYAERLAPGRLTACANRVAGMGYAIPGGVIAVGVMIPLAALDNGLDAWAREALGVSTGLLLSGSIGVLLFAYLVRFLAVALNTVDAGFGKITPSMDHAARTLGAGPAGALARVHAPILSGALLTAALIVFVDVMKELPATLIMRPFNFDTLAVQAHRLASDERLTQAATPSLVIVAVGMIPVIVLSARIRASRPGRRAGE
ncbi:ABC transporter permease [Rubrimonas cliftonensis]|uniref:Iron(III) transport system permease protein n=1 Tax=Rubrimonas cliftonensis TaxID=89524 RepID=A0A1H3XQL5_9RHOB|nr:iron ABC transporter permease [Rubrimonas cliftonensis]SEA00884.1 iron(III) transport system permease protein [Rubrimonas cliftonensis]